MTSLLTSTEKQLKKLLTKQPENKAELLLLLAERRFLQGDRKQASQLVQDALESEWPENNRNVIVRQFIKVCLLLKETGLFLQRFIEIKLSEFSNDSVFQQIRNILFLNHSPAVEQDLESSKIDLIQQKNDTSDIDTRRFLIKQLLLLPERLMTIEERRELVWEFEQTSISNPLSIDDRLHILQTRQQIFSSEADKKDHLKNVKSLLDIAEDAIHRAQLNSLKGQLLEDLKHSLEAIRSYEAGLRYLAGMDFSLVTNLRLNLARKYGEIGLFRQAFREIKLGLEQINITREEALQLRLLQFQFYRHLHRFKLAHKIGQLILKFDLQPHEKAQFLLELSTMLFYSGDLDAAEIYSQDIDVEILTDDSKSDYYFLCSQFLMKKDDRDAALPLLKQAVELTKNDRTLTNRKLHLARLYRDLGRLDDGIVTFKDVSLGSPETEEAETAVTDMKQLREELESSKLDDVVTVSKKKKLIDELSEEIGEKTLYERLQLGLRKTRGSLVSKLENILGSGTIGDDIFDEIEETLILADVGFDTTNLIISRLRKAHRDGTIKNSEEIKPFLVGEISAILQKYQGVLNSPDQPPFIVMMIGVNGVGKTTTIAKLSYVFLEQGKSVILAAADTFRAGAIEQISEWGSRLNVDVVKHKSGADPSAVAYDAIHAARARGKDVLIIDTAGRLHTKVNLMEELKKIRRIVHREMDGAPHEILLVLDATNGQNAISQAKIFKKDLDVSGIILTKLDGTAKGGIIISIVNELEIPIKYIGVGEKMYDLRPFDAKEFVEALFGMDK